MAGLQPVLPVCVCVCVCGGGGGGGGGGVFGSMKGLVTMLGGQEALYTGLLTASNKR